MTTREEASQPHLTTWKLALYFILFFAVWTVQELYIRPMQPDSLNPWLAAFLAGLLKVLVWTVPAWWLVRRYPQDMAMPGWFAQSLSWLRLAPWLAIVVVYNVVYALVYNGVLRINPAFTWLSLVGTVLFVGITEEAVFRGLLLNTLLTRMSETKALCVSAGLFVLIHIPIWITKGLFAVPLDALRTAAMIFVLGIAFGTVYIREKNLWAPILLHMTWNLAVSLLQG